MLFRAVSKRLAGTGVPATFRGIDPDKSQVSPVFQLDSIPVKYPGYANLFIIGCAPTFSTLGGCRQQEPGIKKGRYEQRPFYIRHGGHSPLFHTVFLTELVDPARGIQQFLFAGVEWMALGADFNGQIMSHG